MQQFTENDSNVLTVKYNHGEKPGGRVALFSSYSFAGTVEDYVLYYLEQLSTAGFSIVFISTSPLTPACVDRLSRLTTFIAERSNCCPDFGSWKAAIEWLDLSLVDTLLLVNDSVFGPFRPIGEMVTEYNAQYDLWGMTESREMQFHLQSYFLCFSKKILSDAAFKKFWEQVSYKATKEDVIRNYEIGLTVYFRNLGFKVGAFISTEALSAAENRKGLVANPMLVFWKVMIDKYRFPFLKRELLIKMHISSTYRVWGLYVNTGGWRRTIRQNSDYPVALIDHFQENYAAYLNRGNRTFSLEKRKLLFLINGEKGTVPESTTRLLKSVRDNRKIPMILLILQEVHPDVEHRLCSLGTVISYAGLSSHEKRLLKERLCNEVVLLASDSLLNLPAQKHFTFLNIPQLVIASGEPENNPETEGIFDYSWFSRQPGFVLAGSEDLFSRIATETGLPPENILPAGFVPVKDSGSNHCFPSVEDAIAHFYDGDEMRLTPGPRLAFLTHIYYEDSWEEIKCKLSAFDNGHNLFFFSISEECLNKENIYRDIRLSFGNAWTLFTSNIGKDIGGKLALLEIYQLLGIKADYLVFLHDKQSPHTVLGESWRKSLFRIISPVYYPGILALYNDPSTGVVGDKAHIYNEYDRRQHRLLTNDKLSKKLLGRFDMTIDNYDFVAGSMFWMRASIAEDFFSKHPPLEERQFLEAGNVMDLHGERMAHTWERMFSWMATHEGYSIKGI